MLVGIARRNANIVPTLAAGIAVIIFASQIKDLLGLNSSSLPVIWDADFLYGPKDQSGNDTYVLCEINISCVWPFPPQATNAIARMRLGDLEVG